MTATWIASRADRRSSSSGLTGSGNVPPIDRKDLVDNAQQGVERRADRVASGDGHVAVEDFLEDRNVGDESLAARDGALEEPPRDALVGMFGTDEVHENVGSDKNHQRSAM